MKLICKVHGKPAVIVGYGPGRKGRPRAIVITHGRLLDVSLKEIELERPEKQMPEDLLPFAKKVA